jgi:hypothetical protein
VRPVESIAAGRDTAASAVAGDNPMPASATWPSRAQTPPGGHFDPRFQWQHGFDLRGVDGVTLDDVTISDVLATFAGPFPAALFFRGTDGVTVAGNVQAILPGSGPAMVATQAATRVHVAADQSPYREIAPRGRAYLVRRRGPERRAPVPRALPIATLATRHRRPKAAR